MQICVVKLGGSLGGSPLLRDWLRALTVTGAGRVVVVPGGGLFADQVRDAQASWAFDDQTAHHMALLAMEQFALMLCGLQQGLTPAADLSSIQQTLQRGSTPVWMPVNMVLSDINIPQNWSVTSDSLAAWLAARLQASKLILVKSANLGAVGGSVEHLRQQGIVDEHFEKAISEADYEVTFLNLNDSAQLGAALEFTPRSA